jgi:hypothetical protein
LCMDYSFGAPKVSRNCSISWDNRHPKERGRRNGP